MSTKDQTHSSALHGEALLAATDASSIKRAFDLAFAGMRDAPDLDTFEAHFGHALGDLYRLYELAGQPPHTWTGRDATLEKSADGELALAAAWSRKFRTHDLIEVTEPGDLFADYFTDRFGTLVWRDHAYISSALNSPTRRWRPSRGDQKRLGYYAAHLAGRAVLDTLQTGVGALLAII